MEILKYAPLILSSCTYSVFDFFFLFSPRMHVFYYQLPTRFELFVLPEKQIYQLYLTSLLNHLEIFV